MSVKDEQTVVFASPSCLLLGRVSHQAVLIQKMSKTLIRTDNVAGMVFVGIKTESHVAIKPQKEIFVPIDTV